MEITVAYTLRETSTDFSARMFWYKMSLAGSTVATGSFFGLALQYTKSRNGIGLRMLALLGVFPALTVAFIFTNEIHSLFWDPASTSKIVNETLFPSISEAGIGYWLLAAYNFLMGGMGCSVLAQWIIRSRGFYNHQVLWVIAAAVFALIGCTLDVFQASPFPPFMAVISGLTVATALVVYALIPLHGHDILSINHTTVINKIDDCIIVVVSDERITLINPAAEKLLGCPAASIVGKPLGQFLPNLSPISVRASDPNMVVPLEIGGKLHIFSPRISEIKDWSGRISNHVIVLRDVTEYRQTEDRLFKSEASLAEAQRISHVGSWEWDVKANTILCSEEMFRIAGLLPQEGKITLEKFRSFLHPDEAESIIKAIQQNTGHPTNTIEHLILQANGETRHVSSRVRAYRDEFGKPLRIIGSVQDITERKQAEAKIHLQAAALESATNGIMITDVAGNILWANPSFVRMTGCTDAEFHASPMSLFDYGSKDPNVVRQIRESIAGDQPWSGEMVNTRKDGSEYIVDMSLTPVLGAKGEITHYVSIVQDITEKVGAKKQLEHLATHDSLTGLPNRLLFKDRLEHALTMSRRTGKHGAIFFIDLDDFKSVNDVFSHTVGDELLIELAKRLQACLRESDTVARIGGDEFAILLEDIDHFNAELVAQKILKGVAKPARIKDDTIVITTSIGISFFPQDGDTIPVLMKNADLAMYQSKSNNKNTVEFFNHEMAEKVKGQMDLLTYLRFALKNNIFELFYQPKVDSETGKVIGAEALLRLPHPTRKWIPPSEFLPLAEKTDLILLLDEWVIRTACRKKKELLDAGIPDFNLSVNVSHHQIGDSNLAAVLSEALRENNLDPAFWELEISESSAFQNVDFTIKTLGDLKALGIKLAIDDFGKGYSSLNYLASFPLDELKIDTSFSQRFPFSKNDTGIVKGIIAIAQSLGVAVIVEGVENQEQLNFFMDNGCQFVQGNYYSPAVPADEFERILRSGF